MLEPFELNDDDFRKHDALLNEYIHMTRTRGDRKDVIRCVRHHQELANDTLSNPRSNMEEFTKRCNDSVNLAIRIHIEKGEDLPQEAIDYIRATKTWATVFCDMLRLSEEFLKATKKVKDKSSEMLLTLCHEYGSIGSIRCEQEAYLDRYRTPYLEIIRSNMDLSEFDCDDDLINI